MSHNPNTVKSQDDINEGGRKSDVLLSTIDELEKVKKENEELKAILAHMKLTIKMWHTCYDKAASEFNSKIKLAKSLIFLLSVFNVIQLLLELNK